MRITMVISSLAAGGAQRVMSTMVNYWATKQWSVTLLALSNSGDAVFFPLDPRIRYLHLGLSWKSSHAIEALWNNMRRILRLRRAICGSAPDVVISFMDTTNVLTLIATRGLRVPVIVSERIDPLMSNVYPVWAFLRDWTYGLADRVVVQTQRIGCSFPKWIQTRIAIIPNPVATLPINTLPLCTAHHRSIVAIGRLSKQKGFDLLVQAFGRLKDRHPNWRVTILGDGPLRTELDGLRRELGLADHVDFPGEVENPHEFLQEADLFVLPSRYEGFPNALCEAMACGLAVVAADCRTGPREIIEHGVNGLLFPPEDIESLVERMDHLMSNELERKSLGANASKITENLNVDRVMAMWESLVNELVGVEQHSVDTRQVGLFGK